MNEEVKGEIISKIYYNADNHFYVARIRYKGFEPIVSGKIAYIEEGQTLVAKGTWTVDPVHGRQFKAEESKALPPSSEQSLIKFLSSKSVKGIGPKMAEKLVEVHGIKFIDTVIENPDIIRNTKIKGIGAQKLESVIQGITENKERLDLIQALSIYGISETYCTKIHQRYGHDTLSIIQTNPYRLIEDIVGIGFKKADEIALNSGIARDSVFRITAGVMHCMREFRLEGHCGILKKDLLHRALCIINGLDPNNREVKKLDINDECFVIDKNKVGLIIKDMIETKTLIKDLVGEEECIFDPYLYQAEQSIASILKNRIRQKNIDSIELNKYITQSQKDKNFELSSEQKKAVEKSLIYNTLVLTGGPGTGKTSTINIITDIYNKRNQKIWICAPSGKAAKRAQEVTGFDAQTIHRMIGLKGFDGGKTIYNQDNPLPCDLLIIDESSMIDVLLFNTLLKAVSTSTTIVIVGDVDQLPSVGPGKVLADIIDSHVLPMQRLTEIRRQAQDSSIISLAYKINHDIVPKLSEFVKDKGTSPKDDLTIIPYQKETENTNQYHIVDMITYFKRKGFDPIKDMQFLAPMRNGLFGIEYINKFLKSKLNPQPANQQVMIYGYEYAVKDKVIQLKNNYDLDIFNGDIGYIQELDLLNRNAIIKFDDKIVTYPFEDFNELALAYCISIHKSQGGEFPVVFMMLTYSHFIMLKRNLAYTGITRAKQHLVLMTDPKALATAIHQVDMQNRHTKLKDFLMEKSN